MTWFWPSSNLGATGTVFGGDSAFKGPVAEGLMK